MIGREVFWCNHCLNMSTRPRITFDERGWCNACQWMEEKKRMDWAPRQIELEKLLGECKAHKGLFDCIVPVSGGKDGSYVSYMLKHKYNMNVLTLTVRPALSLEIGSKNLNSFIQSGYNHIHLSADQRVMNELNKQGFIDAGFPYYGWLIAIKSAIKRIAVKFDIPLVFYGEDGEVEYGGSTESKYRAFYDVEYIKRIYFEGGQDGVLQKVLQSKNITESDLAFFRFPSVEELSKSKVKFTHWSYFEPWDSYRNYIVAKEHCGLIEKAEGSHDTFTNFAQNDQALYTLHVYLMYLKFGFGRTTQDAGIEIRRGSMTRDQAINLVKMYDNSYPHHLISTYLDYYKMTKSEFDAVLDKFANKDLFEKCDGIWQPKFTVGEKFSIKEEALA